MHIGNLKLKTFFSYMMATVPNCICFDMVLFVVSLL